MTHFEGLCEETNLTAKLTKKKSKAARLEMTVVMSHPALSTATTPASAPGTGKKVDERVKVDVPLWQLIYAPVFITMAPSLVKFNWSLN